METRRVIAISGPDNVGKSTQLRILGRRWNHGATLLDPLHEYDPRWMEIMSTGTARWWFNESTVAELADVLACSYLSRLRSVGGPGAWLIDRGLPMLEACLAATVAVREDLDDDAAARRAGDLLAPFADQLADASLDEIGIVLLHDEDPEAGTAMSLHREEAADEMYRSYQRCLNRQVQRLVDLGRFTHATVVGQRSIIDVQNEIRNVVRGLGLPAPEPGMIGGRVVAFGGLSESGKSSAAAWLHRAHGFARLKIGYLLETAAAMHGVADVYALPEAELAELFVDALDRFCTGHRFVDRISIESLHRDRFTAALQTLLGDVLTVVYLDTSERVRRTRGAVAGQEITDRDAVKTSRGGQRVRDLADEVVDNDGSLLALRHRMDQLAHGWSWPLRAPSVRPAESLGLPAHLVRVVDALVDGLARASHVGVEVIAVTGSGGHGLYQHGWSDLDLLVVADTAILPRLREAVDAVRADLAGVKLGLTLVSAAECATGALTPRLLHTLREVGTGQLAVQWCRPGLSLPVPDADEDATASVRDGILAAVEIRRLLLRRTGEPRPLLKAAGLLAKVMLRLERVDACDDQSALGAFAARHPSIIAADLPDRARIDAAASALLAGSVLQAWLSTLDPTGVAQ